MVSRRSTSSDASVDVAATSRSDGSSPVAVPMLATGSVARAAATAARRVASSSRRFAVQSSHSIAGSRISPGSSDAPNARRARSRGAATAAIASALGASVWIAANAVRAARTSFAASATAPKLSGVSAAPEVASVVRRSWAMCSAAASARQRRARHRPVGDVQARLPQRDQVAGEVAAVHRRDVGRLEDAEPLELVPVVEVPAEAAHPLEGAEGALEPRRHLLDRDEPELGGGRDRDQLEADVRRRGPHRDGGRRIFLIVVRRQPVGLLADEVVEEAPVEQGIAHRRFLVRRRDPLRTAERGLAQRLGDGRGADPHRDQRERDEDDPPGIDAPGDRMAGGRADRGQRIGGAADHGEHRDADRDRRPHLPPHLAVDVARHPLDLRRRLPLEQLPARHEQPPERAADRVGAHPRLVGKEDEGDGDLLDAGDRVAPDRPVVRAPALVEGRPHDGEEERHDPRRGDRAEGDQRPADRRSGEDGPRGDEQRELGDLRQAAAQVVEDLPAREQREPVPLRTVRPGDARGQPVEELPVAADPAVLAARVGEVARRIVVVDLDVGRQPGPRVVPLDQVVREQGVLGEAPVRRPLEGIDVVDPLPGEASLAVEVLVDVGHRRRVGVDSRMPGMDRREVRAVRARQRDADPRLEDPVAADDPA
jgi:hypothetical protein